jgi:hypothetical protein
MLEAQDNTAPTAQVVPTVEQLQFLWDSLTQRMLSTKAPDSELQKFGDIDKAWVEISSKPMTLGDRAAWARKMEDATVYVSGVEVKYPYAKSTNTAKAGSKVDSGPITITGTVPWWYWPLRVGAGIAAGWGVYRVVRPSRGSRGSR